MPYVMFTNLSAIYHTVHFGTSRLEIVRLPSEGHGPNMSWSISHCLVSSPPGNMKLQLTVWN